MSSQSRHSGLTVRIHRSQKALARGAFTGVRTTWSPSVANTLSKGPQNLLSRSSRHLEHVLRIYIRHYNRQRPHRALHLQAPEQDELKKAPRPEGGRVRRRDRLGGVLHEYYEAAA
jgi:hypothetical protein